MFKNQNLLEESFQDFPHFFSGEIRNVSSKRSTLPDISIFSSKMKSSKNESELDPIFHRAIHDDFNRAVNYIYNKEIPLSFLWFTSSSTKLFHEINAMLKGKCSVVVMNPTFSNQLSYFPHSTVAISFYFDQAQHRKFHSSCIRPNQGGVVKAPVARVAVNCTKS